jgi:biotin carboxyl carrier protein
MKYVVEFENGERFEIELDDARPDAVRVGGRLHHIEVQPGEGGAVVATEDGTRTHLRLGYHGGELTVETGGARQRVRVVDSEVEAWRRAICAAPPIRTSIVPDEFGAPIAGSIARLLVEDGTIVEEGQDLLVIEAMKMQNTIGAPKAGLVKFFVSAGQSVRAGDLIATLTNPESN